MVPRYDTSSRTESCAGLAPIAFRAKFAKIALKGLEPRFHSAKTALNTFETRPRLAAKLIELASMLGRVATMLGRFLSVLRDADGHHVEHTENFLYRLTIHYARMSSVYVDTPLFTFATSATPR